MGPRVLKQARRAMNDGSTWTATRERRETVVIADSGTMAEVLVFSPDEQIAKGAEFHYRGTTWIITGTRRDSGVLVAEPSAH
ncbi:MAG: hypothetical protein OQK55_00930 [Thermoanaerobaculales bacterium]|jgi:FKBP-type peptidyl-prolyl cis-trans isomerase|nr:hypothetical protein [Thermoanaerobaculales bacterium]